MTSTEDSMSESDEASTDESSEEIIMEEEPGIDIFVFASEIMYLRYPLDHLPRDLLSQVNPFFTADHETSRDLLSFDKTDSSFQTVETGANVRKVAGKGRDTNRSGIGFQSGSAEEDEDLLVLDEGHVGIQTDTLEQQGSDNPLAPDTSSEIRDQNERRISTDNRHGVIMLSDVAMDVPETGKSLKAKLSRSKPEVQEELPVQTILQNMVAVQQQSSKNLSSNSREMKDAINKLTQVVSGLHASVRSLVNREGGASLHQPVPSVRKGAKPSHAPRTISGFYYGDVQYVEVKVIFISISDIDTISQQFEAEVYIQAKWSESQFAGMSEEQLQKVEFYQCWDPCLKILNVIGSLDSDRSTMMLQYEEDRIYPVLTYMWHVSGLFKEHLELQHFPFDVQELSIVLSSDLPLDEIELVGDFFHPSHVSVRALKDSQEWRAYHHVEMTRDFTTLEHMDNTKHPVLLASAHVRRRLGFYFWNFAIIVLLILGLSLTVLTMDPAGSDRLSLILMLFLTAVAFKLVVKATLPTISYLTYLDIYVVFTLIYLAFQAFVNAMMTHLSRFREKAKIMAYDEIAQTILVILIVLFHAIFIIYIQLTAFRRRRQMKRKDHEFKLAQLAKKAALAKVDQNAKETQTIISGDIYASDAEAPKDADAGKSKKAPKKKKKSFWKF
ncbi:uncharacterized protein LOC131946512 [Physella acuta]|uniref:uncharacterized protein LOC131946512 n=1 Tax=Physella acuta TaxID=109671 RepID=UPI0027DAF59C|nr:uncharacterized protein LOC131946512 [Physella acuta]